MEFTYEDFQKHYAVDTQWLPSGPLKPRNCVDRKQFPMTDNDIEERVKNALDALRERMGEEYHSKCVRAQSLSTSFGMDVFPAYGILAWDIMCEDWLSLVDFHKGFGRDHSVHQPLTAYIVSKLLGGGKPEDSFQICGESLLDKAINVIINGDDSKYLLDRLKDYAPDTCLLEGNKVLWRQLFYQTAVITAMYHDLGYPWQFMERMHLTLKDDILLCGRLAYMDPKEDPNVNPVVNEYIESHKEELMFRPFYNYGKGGLSTADIDKKLFEKYLHSSHGVPGALAYWAFNKEYHINAGDSTAPLVLFCQEWSSLAILMHDMKKAFLERTGFARLDFKTDPLSFIIALADTMEDFNRPSAKCFSDGKNACRIVYSFPSLEVALEENGGDAELRFLFLPEERASQEKYKSDDQRELFNEVGYFDLPSIGLNSLTIKCL